MAFVIWLGVISWVPRSMSQTMAHELMVLAKSNNISPSYHLPVGVPSINPKEKVNWHPKFGTQTGRSR